MTEETLKCPFCEEELTYVPHYTCDNRNCVLYNSYVKKYHILKIMSKINSLKQKSYSEGYEKGKEESIGYMHKNVCQICKQNRQDEGRMAVCMPCYEKELEK